MEIWHNRTPMMKKRALKNGRPTTATVRFCLIGTDGEGGCTWDEVKGELEVEVPGGAPVVLRGLFNGDKAMAPFVTPGTRLPVALHADKDDKVVIDWDRWYADGGLAAATQHTTEESAAAANALAYGSSGTGTAVTAPTVFTIGGATSDAWKENAIAAWREAVAGGQMTQAQFDQAVADLKRATGG